MRYKRMATWVAAGFVVTGVAAFGEDAPDPKLSDSEQEFVIGLLDDSFNNVLDRISGMSDEQWNFKQNEDRWSVGECVEHIVRSCNFILESAVAAMETEPDPDWFEKTKGKTELLNQSVPNRNPGGQGGFQAPQEIRPTEKWARDKAIRELYKMQGELRAFAESVVWDKPMKAHVLTHPVPVIGDITAYDWLIFVPLHVVRHTKQIVEVQEDEKYPKA